ncbi:hypothetical protein [Roseobacter sp.]|uniref:hypothetical protein n=1 Tax=Roseobacter sp. TaxID=1907202 RepID=UPI00329A6468
MRKIALAAALVCPQVSAAQEFTGKTFLTWSNADQRGYISAQLVMASTIASRIKPDMNACIAGAFFDGTGMSDAAFDQVVQTIGEYQDFHPSSVLVILLENECGTFN